MEVIGIAGYSGQNLRCISGDQFGFASGNGLCIMDVMKGPQEILWKSEKGISTWNVHHISNIIAIAPLFDGDFITIISLTNRSVLSTLKNPCNGLMVDLSFSKDGNFLLGISDIIDHKAVMWNLNTHKILFDVVLPGSCSVCLMNPLNPMSCLIYGDSGLYIGRISEILESYSIEYERVNLDQDDSEFKIVKAIAECCCWGPNNYIFAVLTNGTLVAIDSISKLTKHIAKIPITTINGVQTTPVSIVLSALYIIVGCSDGLVYWYTWDKTLVSSTSSANLKERETSTIPTLKPQQILTLKKSIIDGKPVPLTLTCATLDSTFSNVCLGTSCGSIYTADVEAALRFQNNGDEDAADAADEIINQRRMQETVETSVSPCWQAHDGVALCMKAYTLVAAPPAVEGEAPRIVAAADAELSIFVTGSQSGYVTIWRCVPHIDHAHGGGAGGAGKQTINRVEPRIPLILTKLQIGTSGSAITSLEFLSIGSMNGSRFLSVGTADGYLEVHKLDAFFVVTAEDTITYETPVRLETILAYRKRFYKTAITLLASNESQSLLAIASLFTSEIYIINTGTSRFHQVYQATLGISSNQPVSLIWSSPLLWVSSSNGMLFTFLPDISPDTVDQGIVSANPKVMWETNLTSFTGIVGLASGVAIISPECTTVTVYESIPSALDLEMHNLLDTSSASQGEVEIAMLSLPGNMKETNNHDGMPITFIAKSPNNQFIATGTLDGYIFLWKYRRTDISLINRLHLHTGSIVSICFSHDSSQLITSATDGSIFATWIEKGSYAPIPVSSFIGFSDLNEMEKDFSDKLWIEQKKEEISEKLKDAFRGKSKHFKNLVQNIAGRVKILLKKNEEAGELEKMEIKEFVIDVRKQEVLTKENVKKSHQLQEDLELKVARNELIAARYRAQCWDSMEVQSLSIFSLQTDNSQNATVSSFSVRKYDPAAKIQLKRVKMLRALEVRAQRAAGSLGVCQHVATGSWRFSWGKNTHSLGTAVTWLANDGTRWPRADIIEAIQQEKAMQQAAPVAAAEVSGSGKDKGDKDGKKGKSGDEDDDANAADAIGEREIDENSVFNLLYAPQTVRTQQQKRNQIAMLKEVVRIIKITFNKHFEKLYKEKEDVTGAIAAKNNRIKEILGELGSTDESILVSVKPWADEEKAGSVLIVNDNEISSRPYVTIAMKEAQQREEERKRKEALSNADNGAERALQDFMYGNLEVKRDVLHEGTAIPKPSFMDEISSENWTDSMKKEALEYNDKIQAILDDKLKYRKGLELEMKKLRSEIQDACKSFDEKIIEMSKYRIITQREILAQELYISRLALSMVKREQLWGNLKSLNSEIEANRKSRGELSQVVKKLTTCVDEAKAQLQAAQDEEKTLDRSFKRDLQTLSNATFDQDTLKIFTNLYRQRKYHSISVEGDEGDGDGGSGINQRASKDGAKRRSFKRSFGNSAAETHGSVAPKAGGKLRESKDTSSKDNLGPMQQAARQMNNAQEASHKVLQFNPNDPFYFNLIQRDKERKLADSQIPLQVPLSMDQDCPDGFNVDQFVWSKLQELRLARIVKEIEAKTFSKEYNELKQKLDELTDREEALIAQSYALENSKASIMNSISVLDTDLEVVVSLRQGQDEVDCNAVVTDYSDAKLIPTSIINKYNVRLNDHGKDKIGVLTKIKQFRRKMNLVDWEAKHLEMEAKHYEELFTDCQLFRVTRDLQKLIKEGAEESSKVGIYIYM